MTQVYRNDNNTAFEYDDDSGHHRVMPGATFQVIGDDAVVGKAYGIGRQSVPSSPAPSLVTEDAPAATTETAKERRRSLGG